MVSIILSTYNRAHLIGGTLQSISNQSYRDFECVIIDDGSTDNSFEVIKSFLKDSRFRYYLRTSKYKKGLPGCRNYGLDICSGDFVIFFDDDDIVHPENLRVSLNAILKEKSKFCLFGREVFFGEFIAEFHSLDNLSTTKLIGQEILYEMVTGIIPFNSCAVLWDFSCFNNLRFNEDLLYAEEWECYQRILSNKTNGVKIDQVLYYARKHPESNTGEFYSGNSIRLKSYIEACILIVNNLNTKKIFSSNLVKYFTWVAYIQNSNDLYNSIIASDIPKWQKVKSTLLYKCGDLIKGYLLFKKRINFR